jgi:glycosyltransferase involved in cell wall biosynthesis
LRMENLIKRMVAVSVVMPIYNTAAFLEEAIESILNQTLQDFELILVNDGSTDESNLICNIFTQKDQRIKYIYQENSGVSIARNKGLEMAVGEYVFFMDSDDTIDKDFIKSSYDIAKRNNSDLVVIGDYFCNRFQKVRVLSTWAQLLRMDFLHKYPEVRFPENIQPGEDGIFSHQLLLLTDHVSLNPQGIYNYRQHPNQNHNKIKEQSWKVLRQIPMWFDILVRFYTKYDPQKSHSLHLARFVEHEPFEFRYLALELDDSQKKYLHNLIKDFMFDHVLPYLHEKDKVKLSVPFLDFVYSSSHNEFDKGYYKYVKSRQAIKKFYLFLVRFIPLSGFRRKYY